ncbi:MAG TPA: SRPBCC domain-containing protein [Gaiellaceae bacterium]|nr:SRPBCC domain-containing protein [Gaiellaceae bacterium]
MVVIGVSLDAMRLLLPHPGSVPARALEAAAGIVTIGVATAFYLTANLGPGPRDGWMTGIHRRLGYPIASVRLAIELTVLAVGFVLGGTVGVATFAFALFVGYCLALTLRVFTRHGGDQRSTDELGVPAESLGESTTRATNKEDQMTTMRILGRLESTAGKGAVRMEDRVDTDIDDVWSALTDPSRLARWYGEIEGDLRPGGEYRARLFASGWEGTGRVEACEPPQRLLVRIKDADEPDENDIEVTLTADAGQTTVVWEERGMPLDLLSAYGAGVQLHVEDLADYLAGRERRDDTKARWDELHPAYQGLAADLAQ